MFARRLRPARIGGLLAASAATALALLPTTTATAVTGPAATPGTHPYAVRLQLGGEADARSCTGTLVDQFWIMTAASCFAATPGTPVAAGKPALNATATVGNGRPVDITEVTPRTDRDVVLVRLASPVAGAKSVELAAAAPAAGADVTAAGFGRTKSAWVPDTLHTGTFTVNSADATTLTITGKGADALCKGDTGGPLLNGAGKLVGVNSRSWQGGCLGTAATETRTGAVSARVDDLADWVRQARHATATVSVRNVNSDRCLWVPWQTADNYAQAKQYDCALQYADQRWKIEPVVGGGFQIRNVNSDRCLWVSWQTPGNDVAVQQYDCLPQYADQLWEIEPVAGGGNQIRNAVSKRCLWVPWQTAGNYAEVKQVDCDSRYIDQVWKF
ncbi:trypsin-like serine protease [Streptomyces yangpuensis]